MRTIRAKTMVELKKLLRREMGWPDRRSWTEDERQEIACRFTVRMDFKSGNFVAEPIHDNEPA